MTPAPRTQDARRTPTACCTDTSRLSPAVGDHPAGDLAEGGGDGPRLRSRSTTRTIISRWLDRWRRERGLSSRDARPPIVRRSIRWSWPRWSPLGDDWARWGIALLHLGLGAGTVWMTAAAAERFGLSRSRTMAAAFVVACDPVLIWQGRSVMTETPAAFLVAATLAALASWGYPRSRPGWFVVRSRGAMPAQHPRRDRPDDPGQPGCQAGRPAAAAHPERLPGPDGRPHASALDDPEPRRLR